MATIEKGPTASAETDQGPLWNVHNPREPDPYYSYNGISVALHWLTVVGVATLYFTHGPLHVTLGLFAALLLIMRLIWRCVRGFPRTPDQPTLINFAERLVIIIMLFGLLAITATGLTIPLLAAQPYAVFGFPILPALLDQPSAFLESVTSAHIIAVKVVAIAIGLHLISALRHGVDRRHAILLRIISPLAGGK